MKKKKNTISINKVDYILGSFCLVGMVLSLYMFWKDINISFEKANEPKIAVIYFKHNTAQRRLRDRNVWERLQQSSTIYNGDRIRTAADSEAYTVFNDGTRIDLHENTLIQVFDTQQGNNINFIDGAISVKSVSQTPSTTISSGQKAIALQENTSAILNTSIDNQITAIVSTGAISVTNLRKPKAANTSMDIFSFITKQVEIQEPEEIVKYQEPTNIEPVEIEPVTITAGNAITFAAIPEPPSPQVENKVIEKPEIYLPTKTFSLVHDLDEIPFLPVSWKASEPMTMVFSRTSNFTEVIKEFELPADKTNLLLQLDFIEDEDTIYWQTVSRNADKENSNEQYQSGIVNIKLLQAKQIEESVKQVFGEEKAEVIQKQIEVANVEISKQLVETKKQAESILKIVETPPIETEEILPEEETNLVPEEPTETAKVEPKIIETPVPAKPVETAKAKPQVVETIVPIVPEIPPEIIKPDPIITTLTPQLMLPEKNKKFVETDFLTENPQIEFTWEKIADAENYTFTLYNGNKKLKSINVDQPAFTIQGDDISLLDNGTFKWSVVANQTVEETKYNSILSESTFDVQISPIENIEIDRSILLNAD